MSQNEEREKWLSREEEIELAILLIVGTPLGLTMAGATVIALTGIMVRDSLKMGAFFYSGALMLAFPDPARRICSPPLELAEELAEKLLRPLDVFEKVLDWTWGD
ncbi:hypothetical protein KJ903_00190 [Patescibacteria group bacterium]|nr:hypothetical protein [Patescibacteria group bacterium]